MHDYRTHGKSALRKAGRDGRKPRLSEKQRQQLEKLLVAGPERLGYETPLWTCPRVAHLIEQEFDVGYHEGHVWKILVGLGWSPQRPEGRARERNEEQILNWKKNVWPELKKSAPGEAHHRLHRRKRTESATASLQYLDAARTDLQPAIQLQLEESVGRCRSHPVELLLSHLCRCHQERTGRGFSCGLGASPWSTVADRVGSFAGTPQPASPGVHCWFAGLDFHCLSSTLRAGTEPRRVYLGVLEAARVAECRPQGLLATERNRATNSTSHAPPSATDHRLLEAIFFMARIALYYARVSRRAKMEIDLHGYHPAEIVFNGVLSKILQQAWEMGESDLTLIHGHGRNRGITPGFVNTNTGYFGLCIRRALRNDQSLRQWIKHTTLDCRQIGCTSIGLKRNSSPTRKQLDCF